MVLKKKSEVGGLTLPDTESFYKHTIIKMVCWWCKDEQRDQWLEYSSETDPHLHGQWLCHWNSVGERWSFQ